MQWVKIFSGEQEARQRIQPDRPQLVLVQGKKICLVLHHEKFHAVQDFCTHNGESLSKGLVNYLGEIVCPWHNYRFDLQSGRECASRSSDLKTYPIRIEQDGFFVGIF
ncbi:MAG: nitrite reductase (NAD(P)H) small subunit [Cyclobacteriaceae bacterium]|jgi:nitrite reductase/ring-hydroxylating ferredoxin subunit|nr:nitrite reductase (NAD(P)H) small subunit [Cyclobacteriaceae bacterium]